MWPSIPRSEERPSRPPSGLRIPTSGRRSFSSSGPSSVRSLPHHQPSDFGSKSLYTESDDDGDDSSCDDTYVSMTSSRSVSRRNGRDRSSKRNESDRILKATSRVSNKTRSSSASLKTSKKPDYEDYGENSSTAGILDKLKNDINSLELLRQSTEEFPENEFSNVLTRFHRDESDCNSRSKSAMRAGNRTSSETDFSNLRSQPVKTNHGNSRSQSAMRVGGRESSENDFFNRRSQQVKRNYGNSRTHSSKGEPSSSHNDPIRSVGVDGFFRDANPAPTRGMSAGKPPTSGSGSPWQNKRKEKDAGNEELMQKFKVLEQENRRLQEVEQQNKRLWEVEQQIKRLQEVEQENKRLQGVVRTLKEDSIKSIEHNEKKLGKFSDVKEQLSDIKLQLDESKSKEVELGQALREVINDVESEQEMMKDELSIAYKLRQTEVALLEEKLRAATEMIEEKTDIIQEIESDMERIQRSVKEDKEDKEETEKQLCDKIDSLKLSMRSNESSLMGKVSMLENELERSKSAYFDLEERLKQMSDKLSNSESQKRYLQDSIVKTAREGEESVAAVKTSLQETREESQTFAEKLHNSIRENNDLNRTIGENKETIAKLESSLASATEDHREVNEKLIKQDDMNQNLQKAINKLELDLAEANVSKSDMELKLNDTKGTLESETQRMEQEKEALKEENMLKVNMLEEKNKALKEEIVLQENMLEKKMATMEEERQELITKLDKEMSSTKEEKQKQIFRLEKKIANTEVEKQKQISTLEKNVATVEEEKQKQIVMLEKKVATMKEEMQEQASKYGKSEAALQSSIEAMEEVGGEMKIKLANAEKWIDTLKRKVQAKDKEILDMNEATESMSKKVSDLKSEIEVYNGRKVPAYEAEVSKLRANLGETETKASIMDQEIRSLQTELFNVTKRLQTSKNGHTELQQKMEAHASSAQHEESRLNGAIKTLKSELDKAKKSLEQSDAKLDKVRKESNSRNGQLKSALQSLDEMMKYIENMREENDDIVASLEGDLEKAIKMKYDAEREMKRRIITLEKNVQAQQEGMRLQGEEKKKLSKELEACRIDAMKLVAKAKDDHAKKMGEMKIVNLQARSSEVESLTREFIKLREKSYNEGKTIEDLEVSLRERSSQVESLTRELHNLRDQSNDVGKTKNDLEASLQESSSQIESLKRELKKLQNQSNDDVGKVKKDLEVSLQENSSQVELLNLELDKLREQSNKDSKLKQAFEASMDAKSAEMNSLCETIKKLEAQIDQLGQNNSEEINKIKSSESSWSKKAKEYEDEISEVNEKLEFSVSRHSALAKDKSNLLEKLRDAENENTTLKESLDKANTTKHLEYEDLTKMLEKKMNSERKLRGEVAQKKQMIAILQSNEKHLEEHVGSLEDQINKLVSSYESKLQTDQLLSCD